MSSGPGHGDELPPSPPGDGTPGDPAALPDSASSRPAPSGLRGRLRVRIPKAVLLGTLVGVTLELIGYLLVRGARSEFGWVMFVLVPFVSGGAVGVVVKEASLVATSCMVSGILAFSVLLFTGWEGIVCCLLTLPLAALGVGIGATLGFALKKRFLRNREPSGGTTLLLLLLCPLFIAAADRIERPFRTVEQHEVFTTEALIPASPERTWDLVAEMQRLDGPRPFLLRLGLPVPNRCELDRAAVGGRRVCHFNQGLIAQEVTEWRRPEFMGLRITESTLPGRHWLSFQDASYELITAGGATRLVRHTTIGTRLYPRWYWRPLERWGVTSEHAFVFSNVERWTRNP